MRVLLDSDVVLDFVLERKPFVEAAGELFELIAQGACDRYVSGITPINVFYLMRKAKGIDKARQAIGDLLIAFQVCPITHTVLKDACALPFADYEDAAQHASATASSLDAIVTRNLDDYKNATLPVYSPSDFLNHLKAQT
ncbi:MAG TPA: PIN domain-containing protein [Pyrinomonadaceae bacterium]|jgi:predicted nucleic acid-binding protein